MALRLIANGGLILSDDINQIVDLINGASGKAQPVRLITLDDGGNYCLQLRNLNALGLALRVLNHDNTVLLSVDANGVRLSPDGVQTNLIPMTANGTDTTAGKTIVLLTTSTVASASTIDLGTIGTAGNVFTITGTTAINSIVAGSALTGWVAVLKFNSSGAILAENAVGGNLRLNGDFVSKALDSSITLVCDGTRWQEIARADGYHASATLRPAATQPTANATATAVSWATADFVKDAIWALSPNPTQILPLLGVHRLNGVVSFASNSTGYRRLVLNRNGVAEQELATHNAVNGTNTRLPFSCEVAVSTTTDYFELMAYQTSTASLNVVGGAGETVLSCRRVGNV